MEKRESRDENNVCRNWIQILSCKKCLFEVLCWLEDRNKQNMVD